MAALSLKLSDINLRAEVLAGLTVAMTMIPESLSFAIVAGFPPLAGLYAAFLVGLIAALFGGRPGMVSGGAGATVIVVIALMRSHGIEYVFAAIALAGVIQVIIGLCRFAKFIRLVPQPVMYGFVNGLAVVIFLSQLEQLKTPVNGQAMWQAGPALYTMLALVALTVGVVLLWPRINRTVPASLVAIVVVFAVVAALGIQTKTVADIASVQGGFPPFHLPQIPLTWEALVVVLPYALNFAAVGLTEGLLTLNLVDEITQTKGDGNRECLAQGAANLANGLFSGMGGCPMIAQTMVNLQAGSRARLSGVVAALTILLIVLFGAPVIGKLPLAALVGVMMLVAIETFQWASFRIINKMPWHDVIIGVLVAGITIWLHNLALAVLMGVVASALVFAWHSAQRITITTHTDAEGAKVYAVFGPLFFGSVQGFMEQFNAAGDPDRIVIDFQESRVADMSAIEALNKLTRTYAAQGKTVELAHLSPDCRRLLNNAGAVIRVNVRDPGYGVVE